MTDLTFACTGVRADPHTAGPALVFRLRVTAADGARVHALALRCQLRIEPARRGYGTAEGDRLGVLFGDRSRWDSTLNPIQFAQVSLTLPGFTGQTEADLVVPCTYDMDVAPARYLHALDDGDVPFLLLFSGTAFTGERGFNVEPVPWHKEATVRMPASVWRDMIDQHFPGCGWIRLRRDVLDALLAHRDREGLPSWEATVAALLDGAAGRPAALRGAGHPSHARRASV